MKNLKKFVAMGLAAVMTLSMAACSSSKKEVKNDSEKLVSGDPVEECTISISWWGDEARGEATQAAIAAFEKKYPQIKVETISGEFSSMETKAKAEFPAGTQADICQVNWNWLETLDNQDGTMYYDLNNASEVIDLTQYTEESLASCTDDKGRLEAMPIAMTGRIFYWNEATFDKAGIATPTTYAELLAAGKTFEEKLGKDYYPLAIGEYDKMILMVYYLETKYGKEWTTGTKVNYSVEEIAEGMKMIQELEDNHVIPTVAKMTGDGAEKLQENTNWIDGHYAGIWEWDSSASKYQGALQEELKDSFKVGTYFSDWGDYGGYSKVSLAFAICNKCEHKYEAALLLNFLLNSDEGAALMGTQRGLPISVNALRICKEQQTADPIVEAANKVVMAGTKFNIDIYFELGLLKDKPDGKYIKAFYDLSTNKGEGVEDIAKSLLDGINEVIEEESSY